MSSPRYAGTDNPTVPVVTGHFNELGLARQEVARFAQPVGSVGKFALIARNFIRLLICILIDSPVESPYEVVADGGELQIHARSSPCVRGFSSTGPPAYHTVSYLCWHRTADRGFGWVKRICTTDWHARYASLW